MTLLDRIRRFIFKLYLKKNSVSHKERKPSTLQKAKRIGILFNAEDIRSNDIIIKFSQYLKSSLKEVQILGYLPKREFGFVYPFPYITKKNISWYGKPGGSETGIFLHTRFDLLINFCPEECLPLDYIAALSPSQFRIGFNPDADIANYDLILISKEKSDISKQIKNLENYLR